MAMPSRQEKIGVVRPDLVVGEGDAGERPQRHEQQQRQLQQPFSVASASMQSSGNAR